MDRKQKGFDQERYIVSIDHHERVLMEKVLRALMLHKIKRKRVAYCYKIVEKKVEKNIVKFYYKIIRNRYLRV